MAGLLEVADTEFSRLNQEVEELPDMAEIGVLKQLESSYFQFSSVRGNADLSLVVLKLLLPLYGVDERVVGPIVQEFVEKRKETIGTVFEEQHKLPENRSPFFSQPEVLMVYERLEHDPLAVRELSSNVFPDRELDRIASAFGISFD